ncbi:PREDICTED: beta-fructofuranosidase, insoluble isoenzyme CWINV3-like isoform X1 [Lupinus angustifolius]|uniref:beta-fructofuranosidase, insoluble isoenzyme CWINV3-like isoform X1 n=2 Tax=Lupinus angustifolius TaxID=3871 RepID=UPI00092F6557|nr:PREDICTED: beta-fructofuranosidase, insoluble isoenzyme CWINV3-like isoform X1 [Lupinus angustifolius]
MMKIFAALNLLGLFFSLLNRIESFQHSMSSINMVNQNQPYRTSYHFQPQQNWMNDPNGPMYYKGVYHLFYQHNPEAATFGDRIVWGHSVSYDLINWIHLNHAIEPSEPYDINSCWSGSATILQGEKPAILYTGIDENKHQVQNFALPKDLSDPFLREWVKHPQNPVMTAPSGVEVDNFRDPSTAWKGGDGKWRVVIGAQNGDEGKVILYQSDDFVNWTVHPNPFYASDNTRVCECPDFFPVSINSTNGLDTSIQNASVRHVLKISYLSKQHDYYFLGKYVSDQENFIPDIKFTGTSSDLRFDYGKFYASKSFFDYAKNRRILWGWVNESDTSQDDIEKGWAGLQTIPRQVWLDKSGKQLIQWPIEEVEKLHDKQITITGEKLVSGSTLEVSGITASQVDVDVLFEIPELESAEWLDPSGVDPQLLCSQGHASISGTIGPFGLLALAAKDLTEQTAVYFRIYKAPNRYIGLMCSDQSRSSLRQDLDKTIYGTFFDIDPNVKTISLRSLIDHSIIESFGEKGRVCITSRVYPSLAIDKEAHLYVFNNGIKNVVISKLNAWSMKQALLGNEGNNSSA